MKSKILSMSISAVMLTACQSAATPQYKVSPDRPKPTQADIAKVSQALVDVKCRGSKGQLEYEACLTIVVAQMPQLDPSKRDHFGEQYDPKIWYACMQEGSDHGFFKNDNCDVYQLRRLDDNIAKPKIDMPEIKWPRSTELPAPSRVMSKREYFDFLCKSEAGETVYKTVENVPGLLQMRPAFEPTDVEYSDRYVLEDPYSITREDYLVPWEVYVQPIIGKYDFLEVWSVGMKSNYSMQFVKKELDFRKIDKRFIRFFRDANAHPGNKDVSYIDGNRISTPNIVNAVATDDLEAKYGYTWRGLGGAALRELGIAGGDQVVVDLGSGEVLGFRRSFVFSNLQRGGNSVWWMGAAHCNKEMTNPTDAFVKRVLKPIHLVHIPD